MNRKVIGGTLIGIVALSLIAGLILSLSGHNSNKRASALSSAGAVGVVSINGAIVCGRGKTSFGSIQSGSEDIISSLHSASENRDIGAIVLRMNSPGGTAAGAQEIAAEIDKIRNSGKK